MLLPGLVNSATDGAFIDLVHAMGRVYTRGKFLIEAAPVGWIYNGVERGVYDLGLPTLRLNTVEEPNHAYKLSTASFGRVNFVLYSHKSKPLTRVALQSAIHKPRTSPYQIEAPNFNWGFPTLPFTSFENALRKVEAGRIDALLWAQEEADHELRRLGLRNIRRESFGDFEDVMFMARSKRGEFVDSIVSECIRKLTQSGELQKLYTKIHRPHDPWQP